MTKTFKSTTNLGKTVVRDGITYTRTTRDISGRFIYTETP